MRLIRTTIILITLATVSCDIKPQPISYGKDVCQFCSMIIVDQQHGSELVTRKGKVYKFDAVECMINYLPQLSEEEIAMKLCNHFSKPGELIPAQEALFLISEEIPSPMGAFLTAFKSYDLAQEAQDTHGGTIYTWQELHKHWKDRYVYFE